MEQERTYRHGSDPIIFSKGKNLFTFKSFGGTGLRERINEQQQEEKSKGTKNPNHTEVKPDDTNVIGNDKIAFWGDDNLFPQRLIEKAQASTIIAPTLDTKRRMLYAGGLAYGYMRDGKKEELVDSEIEQWLRTANFTRYLDIASRDMSYFLAPFPELILDKGRNKIVGIKSLDASFCRFSRNKKKPSVYFSSGWKYSDSPNHENKIPFLSIEGNTAELLRNAKGFKFIYPLAQPTIGNEYYPCPQWYSAIKSLWFDVAMNIPEFKKALMENQINVKFHIEVDEEYWHLKYPDWEKMKPEDREKAKQDFIDALDEKLTGNENAGNFVLTPMQFNELKQVYYSAIKITPIGDKLKDGKYIEDSQEASSHLLYALNMPATLMGNSPSKSGHGAGSGSDVREYLALYQVLQRPQQEQILRPLTDLIADYNGWYDRLGHELKFWIRPIVVNTQDKISPSKRESNE